MHDMMENSKSLFGSNPGGMHMRFENGLTISIQFGKSNYCEHRNKPDRLSTPNVWKSVDAEVAVWDYENNYLTGLFIGHIGNGVVGYLSTDEVADIIHKVKSYTP